MDLPFMLDIRDIAERVFGVGVTKAWELMGAPAAPMPVKLGPKATRWFRDEVLEYARALPRQRCAEPTELQRGRVYRSGRLTSGPLSAPSSELTEAAA